MCAARLFCFLGRWHTTVCLDIVIIENFPVATTIAFPKRKRKLNDDQANLEYPKTKLTEALLQCMVYVTCLSNKIKFHYAHSSACLWLSMMISYAISQFVIVLLSRHWDLHNGYTYIDNKCYEVAKCKKEIECAQFISYFVKKWYGHGCTSHTDCYGSEILKSTGLVCINFNENVHTNVRNFIFNGWILNLVKCNNYK